MAARQRELKYRAPSESIAAGYETSMEKKQRSSGAPLFEGRPFYFRGTACGIVQSQSIFATSFTAQAISTAGVWDVFGILSGPSDKLAMHDVSLGVVSSGAHHADRVGRGLKYSLGTATQ